MTCFFDFFLRVAHPVGAVDRAHRDKRGHHPGDAEKPEYNRDDVCSYHSEARPNASDLLLEIDNFTGGRRPTGVLARFKIDIARRISILGIR